NLEVVFRRLAKTGNLYAEALGVYTQKMQDAMKNKKPASEGLQLASREIDKKVQQIQGQLLTPVRSAVPLVTSDEHVPEAPRLKMSELWTVYTEMKSQFDKPQGTAESFFEKTATLREQHKKVVESLQLLTGVDRLDCEP